MFRTILFILLISGLIFYATESIGMTILVGGALLLGIGLFSHNGSYQRHEDAITEVLRFNTQGVHYGYLLSRCQNMTLNFSNGMFNKVLNHLKEEGFVVIENDFYRLSDRHCLKLNR